MVHKRPSVQDQVFNYRRKGTGFYFTDFFM